MGVALAAGAVAVVAAFAVAWCLGHVVSRIRSVRALPTLPASAPSSDAGGARARRAWPQPPEWLVRRRRAARYDAALPDGVDAIARALRSGASLRQALAEAAVSVPGEVGADLAAVATAAEWGMPLVEALEQWASRREADGVHLVVAALCLGTETGGATAQATDGIAATLRQRRAGAAEVRALSTQARVSAAVIAVAPVAFALFAGLADRRTAGFLLGQPLGLACLAGGLALDALGALWMTRIVRMEA